MKETMGQVIGKVKTIKTTSFGPGGVYQFENGEFRPVKEARNKPIIVELKDID